MEREREGGGGRETETERERERETKREIKRERERERAKEEKEIDSGKRGWDKKVSKPRVPCKRSNIVSTKNSFHILPLFGFVTSSCFRQELATFDTNFFTSLIC